MLSLINSAPKYPTDSMAVLHKHSVMAVAVIKLAWMLGITACCSSVVCLCPIDCANGFLALDPSLQKHPHKLKIIKQTVIVSLKIIYMCSAD